MFDECACLLFFFILNAYVFRGHAESLPGIGAYDWFYRKKNLIKLWKTNVSGTFVGIFFMDLIQKTANCISTKKTILCIAAVIYWKRKQIIDLLQCAFTKAFGNSYAKEQLSFADHAIVRHNEGKMKMRSFVRIGLSEGHFVRNFLVGFKYSNIKR